MASEQEKDATSVAAALQEWRAAERTVAVARRGKLADADADVAMADVDEAEAHAGYRGASAAATARSANRDEQV